MMSTAQTSEYWLSVDGASPGEVNMAIDRGWLFRAETERQPFTFVRFYRWARPTITIGKHQKPERAVNLAFCRTWKVPVISRPTGGRAVLHGQEVTYAVVSNDPGLFRHFNPKGTYSFISVALRLGLGLLGVPTDLASGVRELGPIYRTATQLPCFSVPSRSELVQGGRKMIGSAQRWLRRSFLQHGSIPLSIDYPFMSQALGVPEQQLRNRMVSVSDAAGRTVEFSEVSACLAEAFAQTLSVEFKMLRSMNAHVL